VQLLKVSWIKCEFVVTRRWLLGCWSMSEFLVLYYRCVVLNLVVYLVVSTLSVGADCRPWRDEVKRKRSGMRRSIGREQGMAAWFWSA